MAFQIEMALVYYASLENNVHSSWQESLQWKKCSRSNSIINFSFRVFGLETILTWSDFLGLTGLAKNELENDQFEVISF